jgi:alkaline phosphatase
MFNKISLSTLFILCFFTVFGQETFKKPQIHSHNDYLKYVPFYEAYINGASSIEIDVFIHKDELYVAHDFDKIKKVNTFEELYVKPLVSLLGRGELSNENPLQYLFDIKSDDSIGCLKKLEEVCAKYPQIFGGGIKPSLVNFIITGNRPEPKAYKNYSKFILFDGRPYEVYTEKELEKIGLISDNFRKYSRWNGKGRLIDKDMDTLIHVISKVHTLKKPIRFWATPDSKSSWEVFHQLGVDFVNTDNTKAVSAYFENAQTSRYFSPNGHTVDFSENATFGKVKNVILMIGDGMGLAQLSAGLLANKGELYMSKFSNYGFSMTQAADDFTTDSAAGGTAMATGSITKNRYIGLDASGNPLKSLVDLSSEKGMKAGIVTTDNLVGATPSAFYGHQSDRDMSEGIVNDFIHSNVDLFIGNGKEKLEALFDNGVEAIRKNGYSPVIDSFENLRPKEGVKPVVLVSNTDANGEGGNPLMIKKMATTAIKYLNQNNDNGFFLMVESAKIDSGGHNNSTEQVIEELLAFDKAVGEVIKFAEKEGHTLVIVTADHETGGMSLPQGNKINGMVQGMFHSHDHTGIAVPVMAYGAGANEFSGIYQNIEIFNKILSLLNSKIEKE